MQNKKNMSQKLSTKIAFVLVIILFTLLSQDVVITEGQQAPGWISEIMQGFNKEVHANESSNSMVGILFKDLSSGETWGINSDLAFNPASVIKLPIMAEVFHQKELGHLSLDDVVVLQNSDRLPGAGDLQYFSQGKPFSVKRLVELMICNSDNTATQMLIRTIGTKNINDYMLNLGLTSTYIRDKTMMTKKIPNQNTTSPRDMMVLLEKIYKGDLVSSESSAQMLAILKKQHHRWGIPRYLPNDVTVANKTGSVDGVRNDVALLITPGKTSILCIFSMGLPERRSSSIMVSNIAKMVYEHWVNSSEIFART